MLPQEAEILSTKLEYFDRLIMEAIEVDLHHHHHHDDDNNNNNNNTEDQLKLNKAWKPIF